MKILQVCSRYFPNIGGVETYVRNISERLIRKFDLLVYTTDPSGKLPREEVVNGVKIRRFKSWAPNEAYYFPHPNMLSGLSTEPADIIHTHNIHTLTTFLTYAVHKSRSNSKFIISPFYHGKGHTKLAQMLWLPYRPLAKKALNNADGIIFNSKAQRALVEKTFGPSSKMFLVYDGVNIDGIKNAALLNLSGKIKILLYVGRLEKYKNVHITIAAMRHLPDDYHFYIVGTGPFRSFLENQVNSLGLQNRVHFLGFQSDNSVFQWLKTANVFVHLSNVESFGMTCIESLAAGTPVIANDDGFGLSETIALYPKHIRVFSVSRDNVSRLVELIMEVSKLKPITADVSRFSWDCIAESIGKVYERILED